jgi:carboxypeptidase PM20D1
MKKRLGRVATIIALLLAGLVLALVARTAFVKSRQPPPFEPHAIVLDERALAEHLGAAIRIATISNPADPGPRLTEIRALHALLEATYPNVHRALSRAIVREGSLLYTWKGKDPGAKGVLLMAHLDVVPIEPGTESKWTESPFSGAVSGGFVWGRGALDDKVSAIAILEAVEGLAANGYQPPRNVYLAFGHDEEVSGRGGAMQVAALLKERNVRVEFTIDEGNPITVGIVPGIAAPVAVVGLAEKGYATAHLDVTVPGGHSATPPRETTVGILSKALAKLEDHPMQARLDGAMQSFGSYAAPEMPLGLRLVFANEWLTSPLLIGELGKRASTGASIRTTTALTMFQAGVKDNVLPATARATINFRILPGDTSRDVLTHIVRVVDDPRVQATLDTETLSEPSPTSSAESAAFIRIARTVRTVFPDAVVAPSLFLGATDSRHMVAVSDDTYRFLPVKMTDEDIARLHATNERVAVTALADAVRFYRELIEHL